MRRLALLLIILSISFAQYQLYIVRANDTATERLLYDNNSTSYKDNSLENPDALLRICALAAAELQNKYVMLAYADGTNPGDYIEITHFPVQITYVPPDNCVYLPLDISSFKAWYPSIPFVFVSNSPDMSGATRQKMFMSRGWLIGNYTVISSRTGNQVNITVTGALDDGGAAIVPDVNFLVVGLMMDGVLTTTDTAITSPNDPVVLSLGSYTGAYYIHVNGIGPGIFPPVVDIISPAPTTYPSGSIPFIYTITPSEAPVDSCWYVLDGVTTHMPDCTISYILSVGLGTHSLFLYANDTEGNIGHDSVVFTVAVPPSQTGPPGAPHIPQPQIPPSYDVFDIHPENIHVTINYPLEGQANFTLYSLNGLTDVYCFVKGDFENYTTVELESGSISANSTIHGTITVDMPPTDILEYNKKTEGLLQCVGRREANSSLMLSAAANVYLTINKPLIMVENVTLDMLLGENKTGNLTLTNIGNGSAYAYNLSAVFGGPYAGLLEVAGVPGIIYHNESGPLFFTVSIPRDLHPGVYRIPLMIYENGRLVGSGYLTLFVKEQYVIPVCIFPDLRWTVIILVLGAAIAVWLFKREKEKQERGEKVRRVHMREQMENKEKEDRFHRWRPHIYAALAGLLFFVLWIIVVWLLARCTYVTM